VVEFQAKQVIVEVVIWVVLVGLLLMVAVEEQYYKAGFQHLLLVPLVQVVALEALEEIAVLIH
jgi:hypothetical protein